MTDERHERQYQAYQSLKRLNDAATDTMKLIAYDQIEHIDWDELCTLHREAFEQWMIFAEGQIALPSSLPTNLAAPRGAR